MNDLDSLARDHHAFVKSDNRFQRRARVLQAIWRGEQSLPPGEHRGNPLGSRLVMPEAREQLTNYLTPTIREVVRAEVLNGHRTSRSLYAKPRIFNDLLSSQPLCFNLFGELARNHYVATRALRSRVRDLDKVLDIRFEWSPGRGDPRFTGDKSAFDVFVDYTAKDGSRRFLGIEVKYHEDLSDKPASHKSRYDEVAEAMGCFREDIGPLKEKPLQQIWRDHLLAGALAPVQKRQTLEQLHILFRFEQRAIEWRD